MIEKLNLTENEFVERMIDLAKNCLELRGVNSQSFLGSTRQRERVLKRRSELPNSLLYHSLYEIDEIPLKYKKRYLDILAYFAF